MNEHKVEFIIVGGFALAFHGVPRFTGDIDVFIDSDSDNVKRVMNALIAFGFGSLDLSIEDFQKPDNVIQLGHPPVRIDIVTSISGVSWDEANSTKEPGLFGDVPVSYIGKKQFIINKRATGRKKDLADLESLGED